MAAVLGAHSLRGSRWPRWFAWGRRGSGGAHRRGRATAPGVDGPPWPLGGRVQGDGGGWPVGPRHTARRRGGRVPGRAVSPPGRGGPRPSPGCHGRGPRRGEGRRGVVRCVGVTPSSAVGFVSRSQRRSPGGQAPQPPRRQGQHQWVALCWWGWSGRTSRSRVMRCARSEPSRVAGGVSFASAVMGSPGGRVTVLRHRRRRLLRWPGASITGSRSVPHSGSVPGWGSPPMSHGPVRIFSMAVVSCHPGQPPV